MLRTTLISLGVLAWIAAVGFGMWRTVRIDGPVVPAAGSGVAPVQSYEAVNVTGAAAALGFSIAGGLCFLAAGLTDRRAGRD